MNNGCCPTHGIGLEVKMPLFEEDGQTIKQHFVSCPRLDCTFQMHPVRKGSKLEESLEL